MKVYTKPAIKFIAVFLAVLMLFSALPTCFAASNTYKGIAHISSEYYVRNKSGGWKLWSQVYVTNKKKDAALYWEVSYPGYSKTWSSKKGKDLEADPVYIPLNFNGKKKMSVNCKFYAIVNKKKTALREYKIHVKPQKMEIGFIS